MYHSRVPNHKISQALPWFHDRGIDMAAEKQFVRYIWFPRRLCILLGLVIPSLVIYGLFSFRRPINLNRSKEFESPQVYWRQHYPSVLVESDGLKQSVPQIHQPLRSTTGGFQPNASQFVSMEQPRQQVVHPKTQRLEGTGSQNSLSIGQGFTNTTSQIWRNPNCRQLIAGDQDEIEYTRRYLMANPYKMPSDESVAELSVNCTQYRSNFHTSPLSIEEKNFPIAFGMRLYDRTHQAERILRAIYRPQNLYCLYIDKKSDEKVHTAMRNIAACFDNVFIASKLENFYYQSFSPVEADLQCMKDLLNLPVPWKYFINLAGTEFPLKTNLEMVHILKLLNGSNDIEQYPFPYKFDYRVDYQYMITGNSTVPSGRNKDPFVPQVDLQKGSSYNLFSRAFIEWVLKDDFAQRFITWSKDTMAPDETVWATLNHLPQTPGGYPHEISQVAKNLLSREVVWAWSTAYCWGEHYVHGICILAFRDLGRLSRRWEFFANKFDPEYDHIVLDCLEELHENKTRDPLQYSKVPFDFISTFPQVKGSNSHVWISLVSMKGM